MSNLLDGVTRHQIFVQRYAAGREREAVAFIERMIKTVNSRLASDITDFSRGRLESILFDLEQYAKETLASYSTLTVQEALKFAEYEIGFNERLLGQNISASLTVPAPNQVSAAMFSSVMNVEPKRGYTIEQALKAFEGKKSSQIVDTIRSGVILGDTREQITSALVRMGDLQKQQAATLTRTITNHVSTEARSLFMDENEDVLEGYEWVATLDSRTSLICSSRDGTVYPFTNDPIRSPKPPAHFSCRSTIVPKVKDEFDLTGGRVGVRPAIGADGVEQVRGSTDYQSWLTRQPKAFQVEVLGKERAELFRKGDLKLTNFVDSAGETISLNRLRELEPLAFQKAGVEVSIPAQAARVAPAIQRQAFAYESFVPVKNAAEAENFLIANKISEKASLSGFNISGINQVLPAFQEAVERFGVAPIYAIGPSTRFNLRGVRNANAAIFNRAKNPETGSLGVFHAPTKFGNPKNLAEQSSLNKKTQPKYYQEAKNKIAQYGSAGQKTISSNVEDRFNQMDPSSFAWSMSANADVSKMAATTVFHEYGHVLHLINTNFKPKIDAFLQAEKPLINGWDLLISKYSGTKQVEYVAEAFALYMTQPENQHFRIHPVLLKIFKDGDKKK